MATTQNLQWLPADLRGLPAFPSNGMLYIYKPAADGEKNELRAMVPSKSHLVIQFPEGTTISGEITPGVPIPRDTVDSAAIQNDSVQEEDLKPELRDKINDGLSGADRVSQEDLDAFRV